MNVDPEVTLTTSLFLEPWGILEVAAILRDEDFRSSDTRKIYRALCGLAEQGAAVDTIAAFGKLKAQGMTDTEAIELIDRSTDGVPIPGNAKRYALLVRDAARKRVMTSVMQDAASRAESGDDPSEVMRDVMQRTIEVEQERPEKTVTPISDHVIPVLDQAAGQRNGDLTTIGIRTGIDGLDGIVRGINAGEFWVVGAMPGRGKTAFATQVAMCACESGSPVLFISMEMTAAQLLRRILGMTYGASQVRNPSSLSADKWNELTEYAGELAGIPLYVEDSSSLSASDLAMKARLAIRQYGIKLVIVDYLQLIRGSGKELRERVSYAANMLRQLAKDTGVPVLALSQLRRPGNLNDVPSMIDLKESGDIEAHAHTVILIYMPQGGEDRQPTGEDELIVGKQRNGSIGMVPVYFDRKTLMFRERSTR